MASSNSDTIRILVSTDNHVGFEERDPVRKDDSWRSFDEVMALAKERDVDMVLLAGDLFHDNKPSRSAMYQVMRSLRENCLGNKPCELEILSDKTEAFEGQFDHVNYEDENINVAIPVFSIHGNHDDPTGEGHLAALDLLQIGGLVNYYGRTHESDNIQIKPVLLQKGRTKLALYGMSNVRDERLFRTFRDGKVKFFQPSQQKSDWFNLMSVHQNRHAYTETGYLPENFLPSWMDLIIWGHEHESLIYPLPNAETGFDVIQPGSTVATSLVQGESEPKHVCILSITGREYKSEAIRLKSVRPFKTKDIVLAEDKVTKKLAKKENNRSAITQRLVEIVEELIEEANAEWLELQDGNNSEEEIETPLPLIRLRVEYTAPEGGLFDCENPQRFSNRFAKRVANISDVVQFWRKKAAPTRKGIKGVEVPEQRVVESITLDSVKVDKLVREFLTAQSLTILPQNSFGDAVTQFVDKDDKHAMELFVSDSLKSQVDHLLTLNGDDDEDMLNELDANKSRLEELFTAGTLKANRRRRIKPPPAGWDSNVDGHWSDNPGAVEHGSELEGDDDDDAGSVASARAAAARGRGRPATAAKAAPAKKTTAATKKVAPAAKSTRGRKKQVVEEEESDDEVDEDVQMNDADDQDNSQLYPLFVQSQRGGNKTAAKTASKPASALAKQPARKAAAPKQTSSRTGVSKSKTPIEISEDDDDDDDAFEPTPATTRSRAKR